MRIMRIYGWKHAGYIPDLTPQEKRASWLFSGRLARADGAVETEKDQERLGKSCRSMGLGQIRSRLAAEPWNHGLYGEIISKWP